MMPDQSMSSRQPKKNSPHPSGTKAYTCSGLMAVMAMIPITMHEKVMIRNWITSVPTTL